MTHRKRKMRMISGGVTQNGTSQGGIGRKEEGLKKMAQKDTARPGAVIHF